MSALDLWKEGSPVSAPMPPSLFPIVAYITVSIGLVATGAFAVQKRNTPIMEQLTLAIPASIMLGIGTVFTFLSVGLYV
ncbi:hypothetical protein INT44_006240 [Umbelopsis vinacea]|uniref:Dolichyl-diphosphooligosaccharide-protein glycosyltransferase subunit OST5 n=1 Tax=Umbelopsis vinacea TaxID=44442 RepID=A0A8H7UHK7_9FUNG|nr:hypothetical protein INT44_006240 [Umbelopsis vinacea]KAI9286224.1 hypothetical protein BC943DRAFT_359397 [Umbelopsis sp. AD052]